MGAWLVKPECGVPYRHYINAPNGVTVVSNCSRLSMYFVGGFAITACLALLVASLATKDDEGKPIVPMWSVPLPLLAAAPIIAVLIPWNLARFHVDRASWEASEMSKSDWLNLQAADLRTKQSIAGSWLSSSMIAGVGLYNALSH
jgi:hypothetical protein